jgi:glycosyltransferase involved in cell wall biosynthesis
VAAAGAENYIHFVGSQSRVAEIYALSDVVVSSSRKPESFGRSAAEALAMGTPVVATGHGGILDIVKPGLTGFLFPPGDSGALTEAISTCRAGRLSGLRRYVADRFTLPAMVERTLAVYAAVAGQGKQDQRCT